eukprot:TRINITY_DN44094_c0_g1_i1.p1 TRINITY_DN44094_c0_g1~~TRINITY_DN44094_c0_g1_i1.p1  ORF type:complete len:562 (-),score=86.13 TRINITY_DN44094_c0_g1_i1:396-2081(-)
MGRAKQQTRLSPSSGFACGHSLTKPTMFQENELGRHNLRSSSDVDASFDLVHGFDAFKVHIMGEVERRLALKEDSLWNRGQLEIERLQLEQQRMRKSIEAMQDRQAKHVSETHKIRGALFDVTAKFEVVVTEMREVLRAQRLRGSHFQEKASAGRLSPSPSAASTLASDEKEGLGGDQLRSVELVLGDSSDCSDVIVIGSSECSLDKLPERIAGKLEDGAVAEGTSGPVISTAQKEIPCVTPPRASSAMERLASGVVSISLASVLHSELDITCSGSVNRRMCETNSAASSQHSLPNGQVLQLAQTLEQGAATVATNDVKAAALISSSRRGHAVPCMPRLISDVVPACDGNSVAPLSHHHSDSQIFGIELVKEVGCSTLGVEVNQIDGISLRIEGIDEHGLIARHNLCQQNDSCRVHVDDCIVGVNGVRNDPRRMLHECKAKQRLSLLISRGMTGRQSYAETAPARGAQVLAACACDASEIAGERLCEITSSPQQTQLRCEAMDFVPSIAVGAPPGLSVCTLARAGVSDATSMVSKADMALAASWIREQSGTDEGVVRMLFR